MNSTIIIEIIIIIIIIIIIMIIIKCSLKILYLLNVACFRVKKLKLKKKFAIEKK